MQDLERYTTEQTEETGADDSALFYITEEGGEYPMDLFKLCGTIAIKGVSEAKKDIGAVGETAGDTGKTTSNAFEKIGNAVKSAFKNDKVKEFGESLEKVTNRVQGQQNRLDLLKTKYKDLYLQFGANSKEAKECATEIEKLSQELKQGKASIEKAEKAADKFDKTIDDIGESSGDAGVEVSNSFSKICGVVGKASLAIGGACVAIGGAVIAVTENTREYRREMAKLDTAFTTAGHSTESARKAYSELNSILGETDQAVEAANHLAKLTDNEKDLSTWTDICTGIYATFGASLPIEGLTEASNETAKVGQVTGSLADALNWAGVSEDNFNAKLANCSTEQERQQLIMETLNGLYSDASEEYKKANADVIAHEKAQQRLNDVMAKFGEVGEPIITFFTDAVASMAEKCVPMVENLGDKFADLQTKMQNFDSGDFKTKIASMIPDDAKARLRDYADSVGDMSTNMKDSVFTTFSDNFNKIKESGEKLAPVTKNLAENGFTVMLNKAEAFTTWCNDVFVPAFNTLTTIFTDLSIEVTEKVAPVISNISDKFTELHTAVTDAVNEYILPAINDFITMVQDLWTENEDTITAIGDLFETILTNIQEKVDKFVKVVKEKIIPFVTFLVEIFKDNLDNIKADFQAAIDTWTGIIQLFTALCKGDFKGMWEAIKKIVQGIADTVKARFNLVKGIVTSIGSKIAEAAGQKFGEIKSKIETKLNEAKAKVSSIFQGISDTVKQKIDKAKNTVSDGLDKIKGFFDKLKLKLPDIKLPHFKLNGEFDLGKGKVPSIGVEWYAKGAVLNQPTAFGINPATGKMMVGGEAGAEAVAPIDVLQNYVRQAVMEANATNDTGTIIKLLMQMIELLTAIYGKDTSLKIDGREFGRMVNKYA